MKTLRFNRRARAAVLAALAVASFTVAGASAHAQTSPLLGGDIVVSVYGNAGTSATNTTYTDGVATPISLQEFSATTIAAGIDNTTPLLDETLPTSGTGANAGIVGEFGSSSEGTIQVSGDGQYLTIGGYDGNLQNNGVTGGYGLNSNVAEAQSTDTAVPRIAALINIATGAVDTSTVLNDIYNTNNPRSVYTANGTSFYLSGQGAGKTDQGGIYTAPFGDNTTTGGTAPTGIYNTSSTRLVTQSTVNAATGATSSAPNTYVSIDQNGKSIISAGIFEYSGSPTTLQAGTTSGGITSTGVRITLASQGAVNYSPDGFFFASPTVLYVADTGLPKSGGVSDGGLQKWTYSTTTQAWSLAYTLTSANFIQSTATFAPTSGETGLASLSGEVLPNGTVELFGTSYTAGDANPDGLYGTVDTLSSTTAATNESLVELASSGTNNDFKGVAFIPAAVPEPSSWALAGLAVAGFAWLRRKALAKS